MARLPCTYPGARPDVGPACSLRRIISRAAWPVCGTVRDGRSSVASDMGIFPFQSAKAVWLRPHLITGARHENQLNMGAGSRWITPSKQEVPSRTQGITEGSSMTDNRKDDDVQEFWYSGKVTRRRLVGYGVSAGALGATMLVPAPWRAAFGAEE